MELPNWQKREKERMSGSAPTKIKQIGKTIYRIYPIGKPELGIYKPFAQRMLENGQWVNVSEPVFRNLTTRREV